MKFSTKSASPPKLSTDCLVVPVDDAGHPLDSRLASDSAITRMLAELVDSGDLGKSTGSTLLDHAPAAISARRLLLVRSADLSDVRKRQKIANAVATALLRTRCRSAAICVGDTALAGDLACALVTHDYRFTHYKKPDKNGPRLDAVAFVAESAPAARKLRTAAEFGAALGEGMNLARDLGNLPGNHCTPTWLAGRARKLAESSERMKSTVLGEPQMKKLGMHSLLSVSAGSAEPARLIVVEYRNAGKSDAPIVLVGKGITFDTGGISLKPGAAMDEMKFDMCGAASVLGTLHAIDQLKLPVNVIGVIAAAENMPGSKATKPGDIVKAMDGTTVEILNTDAEGRLVLCDALTYAARYKPAAMIDIATLTGACVIALGSHASGLYSNDDALAGELLTAGTESGDRAWRMPLWDEYKKQLDSPFADLANIGGREAGSVTAACFLGHFTKNQRWAHLDIAGTAWKSGSKKGATGRPVPLLVHYLANRTSS